MKVAPSKIKHYLVVSLAVVLGLFVLSLFIAPLLHPDRKITKVGVVSHVEAAGNPYFYQTAYTITFKDGDIIQIGADRAVPIPIGKPVAISYSKRERKLLDVRLLNAQ